jgi:hypothetical protein
MLPGILPSPLPSPEKLATLATVFFDGRTYDPPLDKARLVTMLDRVRTLMGDAKWRTLSEITAAVGGSEAGVSARLRDLRKPRFGAHAVYRRRRAGHNGLWEYRVEQTC